MRLMGLGIDVRVLRVMSISLHGFFKGRLEHLSSFLTGLGGNDLSVAI